MRQAATMRVVLNEAFKTNFSVFDTYDTAVKNQQILKFSYIEKIAHQLEKNLADVNLFDIFDNNNNIITADEGRINEILIAFDREKYFDKPDPVHEVIDLTEEQTKKIQDVFEKEFTDRKDSIQRAERDYIRRAADRMEQYQEFLRQASHSREQIKGLSLRDSAPMFDSIKKILEDERFQFEGIDGRNRLKFAIKKDIINTNVNVKAGINTRVNLGKMRILVSFVSGLDARVYQMSDNITVEGHWHPHLNSSGSVCLGNVSEIYEEAVEQGNIHGMLDIVHAVLINYNEENPYVSLEGFAGRSSQVQPSGARIEDEEIQEHSCHECDTSIEVHFDGSDYAVHECSECGYEGEYER